MGNCLGNKRDRSLQVMENSVEKKDRSDLVSHQSDRVPPTYVDPALSPTHNSGDNITWTRIQKLKPADAHAVNLIRNEYNKDPVVRIQHACITVAGNKSHYLKQPESVMLYQGSETDVTQLFDAGNGFYSTISEAWATHGNIVLSPDDMWIAIQLQFCRYMEANAEALRYTFVDHADQEELAIDMTGCHTSTSKYDWVLFMDLMMTKIQEKVKNDVADDFLPRFSTSTVLQTSLKHLAVMDSMQRYFTYKYECACGIEQIGLLGTLDDWRMLRQKVDGLKQFHLTDKSGYFSSLREWVDDLLVIVDQFINTYQGKVDVSFWNKVVSKESARAGSGSTTIVDGWLLTFLVGNYKEKCDIQDIPSLRFNVPVDVDDNGRQFKVRVIGGFTGVIRDDATNTYYPQHSLSVIRIVDQNVTAKT